MSAEDAVSIQTRAMTKAQCIEGEVQRAMKNNQEGGQGAVQNIREIERVTSSFLFFSLHFFSQIAI